MAHLKLVAGTDFTGVGRARSGIYDSVTMQKGSEAEREAAARKILRKIKLPGENETIAELLAELDRNACDEKASEIDRHFHHSELSLRLHKFGITVGHSSYYGWRLRTGKVVACLASGSDELLDICPELEPYLDVLCFLTL
ncbi:hypothetical protein PQR66_18395 [Paraburkholderia agricolaris]|uniref:Uncharacterized protein n=1 Tax=Paraburkholderia agricolaris TaxID=2152888 RepID=A0ABW8ZP57_9BURK